MDMPKITSCNAEKCAYNRDQECHAMAITVGNDGNPLCDTSDTSHPKGGISETGGVGACKSADCQFNQNLECSAQNIAVGMQSEQPMCSTYERK